ncbi:MAG: hypothetical protein AAGK23_12380 [Pseudomonadota bacterium]
MIPWSGNPVQGTGQVNPVFTGTRTEGFHVIATDDQSVLLGFSDTPNGSAVFTTDSNSNGFLDAGDVFNAVTLREGTSLKALETSVQRSFYITSRTEGFALSATARTLGPSDALNRISSLDRVVFDYNITPRGNDDGMVFGGDATDGGFRKLGNFNTLGTLTATNERIAEFPNAIRLRASADLPEQSIRFDYVYGFENYDLSLGAGDLRYQIEFDFFRD